MNSKNGERLGLLSKEQKDWAIVRQAWSLGGYNINVCKLKEQTIVNA
jgi:hypothetical protein